MKKIIIFILIAALLLPCLFGCAQSKNDGKINIVCTIFPIYDWVRSIVGESDSVELTLLIQNGADIHSYQPTAADIMAISRCDALVFIGADSEAWVSDALERANNESTLKIALSGIEGLRLHNISSSSHSHDGHDHEEHDHDHGVFDEHLWLSLKNATVATEYLCEQICAIDDKNAPLYRSNFESYKNALLELDAQYQSAVQSIDTEQRFMLFADRFPFVYLLEDYGIEYSAAFEGCTTDVDAGFDTVLRLVKEADEHGITHIAVSETSDKALARTVASSAKGDIDVVVLHSLQSVNQKQLADGFCYLSAMRDNLKAIKTALDIKGE